MAECQEPRCTNEATKSWGGRKVCHDHYDQYEDQHYKNIKDMRDSGW